MVINEFAFMYSGLESLFLPPMVTVVCKEAFSNCENLLIIEVNEKDDLSICKNAFFKSWNVLVMVPANMNPFKESISPLAVYKLVVNI